MAAEVLRYAAFTKDGRGGNPAGVVLDARGLSESAMQQIAAEVGYSETAFLVERADETNGWDVRYFAPEREVPFCGHATLAAAVALADRAPADEMIFHTAAGYVSVATSHDEHGVLAELTSVSPRSHDADPDLVRDVLAALHWAPEDLDPHYPPARANAGAEHLILVTRTRERLARLDYDVPALAALMRREGIVTVALVWPESRRHFYARNPFAGSGVVEDAATGAAAAALGGYLRQLGRIGPTARFTVTQGVEMGRASELRVSVMRGEPGVRVSGYAHRISAD
ncbi:MAG: Phenazine biosynthesis protein PhzF family [Friedmanniella sp.]|nr:Phenazine biosynthesis protein PhzF family [Friedmanniella sp.]